MKKSAQIITKVPDVIGVLGKDGIFLHVSGACKEITGYPAEELEGYPIDQFICHQDKAIIKELIGELFCSAESSGFKTTFIHKAGHEVPMIWTVIRHRQEDVLYCSGRENSGQSFFFRKEHELNELQHAMLENGADILSILDEDGNFQYCVGSTLRALGYTRDMLINQNVFSFIHPDDLDKAKESWLVLCNGINGDTSLADFRFRSAGGEWRWLETRVTNQLQNPEVRALVSSSRDITERVTSRVKLKESEEKFRSLFEANPDMVIMENPEGILLDVNPAVTRYFGVEREEIINKPLSSFLPAKTGPECHKYMQDCLKGKQVNFELEISFPDAGKKVFEVTKIPVEVNMEIAGVYAIFKDITEIISSHNIIKQQAKKLNTIFESITDAFFTLDRNWNFTYINYEFERLLHIEASESIGKNIWDVYPEEVNGVFFRQYNLAVSSGRAVHFEAYLARTKMWLQVKAFPSEEGLSVYFDDITENIRAKQELEKLSLVASKTNNGVMILTAEGITEWVNEGFTKITGYSFSEAAGKTPRSILKGPETDMATVKRIDEKMYEGKPFSEEILNYKKSGEKVWLSLDLTPVKDAAGKVTRIINVQTDVTARKESEESALQLTQELYRHNRDLQQFTYMVSHNLRGPVANALGLTDLLTAMDKHSAEYDKTHAFLKQSVHQLDAVLKDINRILSVRDKKDTLEKEKINLKVICREAVARLQEPLDGCNGKVFVNMGEDELFVYGCKPYFYSIFYNLLSNAVKFRSRERPLEVNINGEVSRDGGVKVTISDNGIGFDRKMAGEKVFMLYKKFHNSSEGRGTGLFLVKSYVEAMDGYIEVESRINGGTVFTLWLK